MPINRNLNRPEIYLQGARVARRWSRLNFPRFVIQWASEINPEYTNEPDDNFSETEAVRAWMQPKPLITRRQMSQDLRLFVDSLGRPDMYAREYCRQYRLAWNKEPGYDTRQIGVVYFDVDELHPATQRRQEYVLTVRHNYLRPVRGAYAVRQIDARIQDTIDGLEDRRLTIQSCLDTRSVDAAIDEVLRENQHIQNGGP